MFACIGDITTRYLLRQAEHSSNPKLAQRAFISEHKDPFNSHGDYITISMRMNTLMQIH